MTYDVVYSLLVLIQKLASLNKQLQGFIISFNEDWFFPAKCRACDNEFHALSFPSQTQKYFHVLTPYCLPQLLQPSYCDSSYSLHFRGSMNPSLIPLAITTLYN